MYTISIHRGGETLCKCTGDSEAQLYYEGNYQVGDYALFTCDVRHVTLSVDQAIAPARVYLPDGTLRYTFPLAGDNLAVYPPYAFAGDRHLLSIKADDSREYRNLAVNPADQRGQVHAYPHATANVETRDESVFAARNVIDGLHIARGHGEWPYQSWGIGARTDAFLTLDFGREVEIDAAALYLRADFPHDAYWTEATLLLSDGYEKTFSLDMIDGAQRITLGTHRVTWIKLDKLVKCDMPSAFPALRQLEVYGKDIDA